MSIQHFETLLQESNIENVAAWLRSLSVAERKELGKDLKPLIKVYTDYIKVGNADEGFTFKQKATSEQQHIFVLANFVCLSRTDFEKSYFPGWIFDRNIFDNVFEWYHPEWLGDFAENLANKNQLFHSVNYLFLAELEQKGYMKLQQGIVCQTLPTVIFENNGSYKFSFKPEILLKYPNTIEKHIWWLFEYESNIHYTGRWIRLEDDTPNKEYSWVTVFTQLIQDGYIERGRVLKEALLASNRNFNKVLSGWFIDLVEALQPTAQELLDNQDILFSLLNASQSKPVNFSINTFKKLALHQDFNASTFLDCTPALMTIPTKSIVTGTLMVLDKLLKQQPDQTSNALQLVVNGFIQQDMELQAKVAKFISKYSKGNETIVSEALLPYRENVLSEAAKVLKHFLDEKKIEDFHHDPLNIRTDADLQEKIWEPIPSFENFDDFLFLCSRVLETNEAFYADLLPAELIKNKNYINQQNADAFAPALKRTFQLSYTSPSFNAGILDFMLMTFFSDFCIILVRRFPDHTKTLQAIFHENEKKYQKEGSRWLDSDERTSNIEKYPLSSYHEFYRLFQRVLVLALHFFKNNIELPILSTPTHQPSWIAPETLIHRIGAYEAAGYNPDILDFQMAMARCNLKMIENFEASLEKLTNPENKGLLRFLFGLQDKPDSDMQRPELWFMASLCRPEKKKYEAFEPYEYYQLPFATYTGEYDFQTTTTQFQKFLSFIPRGDKSSLEQITFQIVTPQEEEEKEVNTFTNIKSDLTLTSPTERVLPEYMQVKQGYLGQTATDLGRALLTTPNNMGPLLAGIADQCLKYSKFWEASDNHAVQATIEVLHRTGCISGKMAHVFVATTMICSNKTSSGVAAEIWIEGVQHQTIDSGLLGFVLGKHYKVEYAPLKRLTDLMQTSMFNISPIHNQALLLLLEKLLLELPDIPIPNLKKLLLLYNEILHITEKNTIHDSVLSRLEIWGKTKSVEPIIKTLIKVNERR